MARTVEDLADELRRPLDRRRPRVGGEDQPLLGAGDRDVEEAALLVGVKVAAGDLLAVAATGAYCRAMASNYNYVPRPPVISVRDGQAGLVLRGETVNDLLAFDAGL